MPRQPQVNNKIIKTICIAAIAMVVTIACSQFKNIGAIESKYHWNNVSIGGGGYVTGVYLHPKETELVYIRTDVGGFSRWNSKNNSWIPLTESFPLAQSHYYGGEALAFDPNNANIVYIAAGKYTADWAELGTILKSSDRGQTWTKLNIDLAMGGNENKRWASERLVVSPSNSQIIFFGSRLDGLWKSSNAGATWVKVNSFSGKPRSGIGITSIVFDKLNPNLVYANAYGDGIYRSTDMGVSWSKILASPSQVNRIALNRNGVMYATHVSGISKYKNGVWQNITPKGAKAGFNAIALDPNNSDRILSVYDQYYQNNDRDRLFSSSDGGATWQRVKYTLKHQVPWWYDWYFASAASDIEFDPKNSDRVWLTDWYGVWRTDDINASSVTWGSTAKGHEELVSFALASPASGSLLLSGVADTGGFNHKDRLDDYPSKISKQANFEFQDIYSIAYAESDPLRMTLVGGNRWNNTYTGATSTDGGASWTQFSSFPQNTIPLRVAMSALDPQLIVVTVSEGQSIRTTDGGVSWSKVSGLPNGPKGTWYWSQPLAADRIDGNTFYYYSDGKVYRSRDKGANFTIVNASLKSEGWFSLKTMPTVKDEVWLSLDWQGFYRSTDGGTTFTKLDRVERAYLFAFGKPQTESTIPALYLYGKITGMGEGIFRSLDRGKTWTSIGDPNKPIGNNPNVMEASMQKFGLVFIGTNGRGIYYGSL